MDECMFTSRSLIDRTWRIHDMSGLFNKRKLTFKAIGVLGVISIEGELLVCIVKDGSIGLSELIQMSDLLKRRFKRRKVNIFLDNLPLHYNK
jgi:hypothetical protein